MPFLQSPLPKLARADPARLAENPAPKDGRQGNLYLDFRRSELLRRAASMAAWVRDLAPIFSFARVSVLLTV